LVLALFYAVFLVWRLSRAWDFNEEKILDLAFFTAFGAFVSARIYFVLVYFDYFSQDLMRVLYIFKYPGFSFWGAFLGGWLTLYFVSGKKKIDFVQIADIAAVGFLGSLLLGDIGCFLGGCDVGILHNSFLGVSMAGQVGKRFPVQALEAILVGILLFRIWPKATHFHTTGATSAQVLIWVGVIKFMTEFLRPAHLGGYFFSFILVALGASFHYQFNRHKIIHDLGILKEFLVMFLSDRRFRKAALHNGFTNWYNNTVSSLYDTSIAIKWRFRNFNKILKKINVKPTPKNS